MAESTNPVDSTGQETGQELQPPPTSKSSPGDLLLEPENSPKTASLPNTDIPSGRRYEEDRGSFDDESGLLSTRPPRQRGQKLEWRKLHKNPIVQGNKKSIALAIALDVFGLILLIAMMIFLFQGDISRFLAFMLFAAILLLPGAYQTSNLWSAINAENKRGIPLREWGI